MASRNRALALAYHFDGTELVGQMYGSSSGGAVYGYNVAVDDNTVNGCLAGEVIFQEWPQAHRASVMHTHGYTGQRDNGGRLLWRLRCGLGGSVRFPIKFNYVPGSLT